MKDSTSATRSTNQRRNSIICSCIFYLLIVVLIMTPVTLSSYVSTATGSNSTSVAKFSLNAETDQSSYQSIGAIQLIPGDDDNNKLIFVVTSNTDVTLNYTITVISEGGMPISNLALSCEKVNDVGTGIELASLDSGIAYSGGIMAIGNNQHTYTLTISVPEGIDSAYSGELQTFYVIVDAVQVD